VIASNEAILVLSSLESEKIAQIDSINYFLDKSMGNPGNVYRGIRVCL